MEPLAPAAPVSPSCDPTALAAAVAETGARFVVLFGSRVTGRPQPTAESDLDLAVRLGRADAGARFWDVREAFAGVFAGYSLDLVLLDTADPLLRWEAMGPGVLLAGDVDEFLEYRAYAYRDFVDSADLRELEECLLRKKLQHLREVTGAAS